MPIPPLRFSKWVPWAKRDAIAHLELPGLYAVSVSRVRLGGTQFRWIPDICYFGMTNSRGGLRARLTQFDRTLHSFIAHGGADRFRFAYPDYTAVLPKIYVAVLPVAADVNAATPHDLRAMGAVAYLEYECFARYHHKFGGVPQFNQRSAPKYSTTERDRRLAG